MSGVICQVSYVYIYIYIYIFFGQSDGASWWMVCYQQGLLRLVLYDNTIIYQNYDVADSVNTNKNFSRKAFKN